MQYNNIKSKHQKASINELLNNHNKNVHEIRVLGKIENIGKKILQRKLQYK